MFNVNKGNTRGDVRKKGKRGNMKKIDKGLKIYKAPRTPKASN